MLISLGNYTKSPVTSGDPGGAVHGALLIEWVLARLFGLRRKTQGWFGSRRRRKANLQTVTPPWPWPRGTTTRPRSPHQGAQTTATPCRFQLHRAPPAGPGLGDDAPGSLPAESSEENPKAELALTLIQTQLQIEQGQYDSALGRLESIYAPNPRHPMLDSCAQVYLAREDCGPHRSRPCPAQGGQADRPAGRDPAAPGVVRSSGGRQRFPDTWRTVWQGLPCKQRQDPVLLASYGDRLRRLGPMPSRRSLALRPCARILPELFARLPKLKLTTTSPCRPPAQKDPGSAWRRSRAGPGPCWLAN